MELKRALQLIHYKRAILFVGSGFSFGAKNQRLTEDGEYKSFQSANDVAQELANMCGEENEGLGLTSQVFREKRSDKELIDFLKREFTVTSISDAHKAISEIDWMRRYTTNYDNILEFGGDLVGRKIEPITLDTNPKEVKDKKCVCIHLNGFIGHLSSETLDNEFKLTAISYSRESIRSTEFYEQFIDDLKSCDVIVFIGFSGLYDLDITRDLMSIKEFRDKAVFIVGPKEKNGVCATIKNYGEVHKIGLEGFIEEWKKTPKPVMVPDREYKCFRKIKHNVELTNRVWAAKDIFSLLWKGEIVEDLIDKSLISYSTTPYVIYRDKILQILKCIDRGYRSYMVSAGLGNGKTIFLRELSYVLTKNGWAVWHLSDDLSTVYTEIEDICKSTSPTAIVIDNSGERQHLLRTLGRHIKEDTLVIFAERSSRYETTFEKYVEFDEDLYNIDIDKLMDEEIDRLIDYLNRHGFWGQQAAKNYAQKKRYITGKCDRQLGKVIIDLIESQHLTEAYASLIAGIREKAKYYRLVLYILCAHEYGFILDYTDLWDVLGTATLNNMGVRKDPAMSEIIDFEAEKITFNSSILADHLLKNHISSRDLMDFLGDIFEHLESRKNKSRKIKSQLRVLMQYRTLAHLTKDNGNIFSFYERLSQYDYCQTHPHFWLQYGIAKTSNRDYPVAQKYFDTAYALAKVMGGYNTYQIDNHHAHMLLKEALEKRHIEKPMELFREIHSKLTRRKKGDEERHYIYRVAQDYPKFWNKVSKDLTAEECVEFKNLCREIIDFGEKFIEKPSANKKEMVRDLIDELKKLIRS